MPESSWWSLSSDVAPLPQAPTARTAVTRPPPLGPGPPLELGPRPLGPDPPPWSATAGAGRANARRTPKRTRFGLSALKGTRRPFPGRGARPTAPPAFDR
jgi:hypothetical protein